MTKISFFVHDLAANPIVRAAALAAAAARDYDVEILGFLHSGDAVYAPYRQRFAFKTLRVPLEVGSVLQAIPRLAEMATGDVIYACKPLVTSLGPALWAARLGPRKPIFLDVEDDEWVAQSSGTRDFVWRHVIKGWRHATAWKYTRALHVTTLAVDGVSVSTRVLQRRYGGVILRHGPDETLFAPDAPGLSDRAACRARWQLPASVPVALFAGVPQPHKGWDVLLAALRAPAAEPWHLALAGRPDHPDFEHARAALGQRCHTLGFVANEQMPSVLAAVDAAPVPQLDVEFARAQLPAKVLEAMAMRVPVVTTRVGDLPEILGNGTRGYLVDPGDADGLSQAFAAIVSDRQGARDRVAAAREWFLHEASVAEMSRRLRALLSSTGSAPRASAA